MKRNHYASILAFVIASLILAGTAFGADDGHYYGVVESFGGGTVVVKTTKHSTGTWTVDSTTKVQGAVAKYDWVFVEVAGNSMEKWNLVETTLGDTGVAVGDEIGCKVYSNNNLAELTIIKHGVQ